MSHLELPHYFHQPDHFFARSVTEEIHLLDRAKGTADANLKVGDIVVIEPDWNKPLITRAALP